MYRIESPQDGGVPPGPRFGLIVALFCVAIFVVIGIAYFVLPLVVHKNPAHPDYHPTSQVVLSTNSWLA
jgi:hypothetical protein